MAKAIIVQEGERYVSVRTLDSLVDGIKQGALVGALIGQVTDEQAHAVGATLNTLVDGIVCIAVEQHLTDGGTVL